MLFFGAFDAASALAEEQGRHDEARRWREYADRVSGAVLRRAYNPDTGLLYADIVAPAGTVYRQANILAVLLGLVRGERAQRIGQALADDKLPPVGTTWMSGFDVAFEHWWTNAKGADAYPYYGRPVWPSVMRRQQHRHFSCRDFKMMTAAIRLTSTRSDVVSSVSLLFGLGI